jgi:hypothetical protein
VPAAIAVTAAPATSAAVPTTATAAVAAPVVPAAPAATATAAAAAPAAPTAGAWVTTELRSTLACPYTQCTPERENASARRLVCHACTNAPAPACLRAACTAGCAVWRGVRSRRRLWGTDIQNQQRETPPG